MDNKIEQLSSHSLHKAVAELVALDTDLAAVVDRFGPPPLWARRPGFATLIRIILEQQVSLTSASAAYRRLQAVAGRVTPSRIAAVGETRLRASGLTRQKAAYCHSLAGMVAAGRLNLGRLVQLPEQEVRSILLELPGVGPWTVDIYLLMALVRPDVWPSGDLALARAVQIVKGLPRIPSQEHLCRIAGMWVPWRAVAARILWHFYLSSGLRQLKSSIKRQPIAAAGER
jgi:DNA-3-methyladenine glycosylase II